jgi:hypothetical protein
MPSKAGQAYGFRIGRSAVVGNDRAIKRTRDDSAAYVAAFAPRRESHPPAAGHDALETPHP